MMNASKLQKVTAIHHQQKGVVETSISGILYFCDMRYEAHQHKYR